jgi:hypothetical protein
MVRFYPKNQYQAGLTTQFCYNETGIELKIFEAILKSGNNQPICFCLLPQRIEAPLAGLVASLVAGATVLRSRRQA